MNRNDALRRWQDDASKFLECTEAFAAFFATQGGIEEVHQIMQMRDTVRNMTRKADQLFYRVER